MKLPIAQVGDAVAELSAVNNAIDTMLRLPIVQRRTKRWRIRIRDLEEKRERICGRISRL